MHISPSIRQPCKHTKQRLNLVTSLGLCQFNPIEAWGGGGHRLLPGCTKTACNRMKLSDF